MELVDKGSLDDLMNLQGRVAEAQVLEVGIQIAQGLNAALQRGLIHRDVKPGNILFRRRAHRQDRGLRPRGAAGARLDRGRRCLGHALLRRAGEARQLPGRFPQRHVFARRDALPRRGRPPAVRGRDRLDGRAQAPEKPGGEPAGLCARTSRAPRPTSSTRRSRRSRTTVTRATRNSSSISNMRATSSSQRRCAVLRSKRGSSWKTPNTAKAVGWVTLG